MVPNTTQDANPAWMNAPVAWFKAVPSHQSAKHSARPATDTVQVAPYVALWCREQRMGDKSRRGAPGIMDVV